MKSFSVIRSALVLVCVLGFGAVVSGQGGSSDDLFGDSAPSKKSGDNFDQSSIDDLFGTMQAEPEKKEESKPARVLPPFHGNYKVLIGRPIYAVYEAETRTKWVSAMAEIYTHYKVASFPRTHAFTMDQVSSVMPGSRDYSKKFNRQHFIAAAKKLGATHLIYQEYQPHKNGKEARFVMELYWIQEGATVIKASENVQFSAFEKGLDNCLEKIAGAMDKGAKNTSAFKQTVLGKDLKLIESFGNILAAENEFTRERAAVTYNAADKIIQKNAGNIGVLYAAALLAGRAESYKKAADHIGSVIDKSGDYPALQLHLADFMRGSERYSEAMRAAETASRSAALKTPASIEMAMIYQSRGELNQARSEYNSIMQSGEADGRVFFRLALLSIQSGNISESENYLSRASESGFTLDESEYIELGIAYGKANGYEDKAIEMLKRGMGVKQNNESAWVAIADIYNRLGNNELEAETYVNLFKINMNAHSGKLRTAGEIYERLGMVEKAKDAYSLFIDRKFSNVDVSMNLARIYFNEKNCKKLPDVLKGYDTIPEAIEMLGECGIKRRAIDASQTMQTKKLSPFMLTMRITTGVFAVGGIAGGIIMDGVAVSQLERYNDFDSPGDAQNYEKVQKMRKDIDSSVMMRNVLYALGVVGVCGFAVTWFF